MLPLVIRSLIQQFYFINCRSLKLSLTLLLMVLCNILLLSMSFAGTAKSPNNNQSIPATIIVLGDSISAAYGINITQGWVSLLQSKLSASAYKHRVINASISGDTTRTGLNRLKPLLSKYQPDIVIVALGGNDGLRGLTFTEIEASLNKIVNLSQQSESKVLLLGIRLPPNYGEAYNLKFKKIYQATANKFNIPLVPNFLSNIDDNNKLMQSDAIHPNANAQIHIVNNIWKQLEKLLNYSNQVRLEVH